MEEVFLKKRINDLYHRAESTGRYTYTGFLAMNEVSLFHTMEQGLRDVPYMLFGGMEDCERQMLRFGDMDFCGYEEPFPIAALLIKPLNARFSEELGHRDILGTLMSLGVEREILGDIIPVSEGYVFFCQESMAGYFMENVSRIRHTSVSCVRYAGEFERKGFEIKEVRLPVASERIDLVIARLLNLSRADAQELFVRERVFVNGLVKSNASYTLKESDQVTVRGFGRFTYLGTDGMSKKGKLYAFLRVTGMKLK